MMNLLGGVRLEYTIQKLGNLAGVSTRTLRYYDEIGILKPARINSSGYRIYAQKEVDRLQQILFYRELGVSLLEIKEIMTNTSFDINEALKQHRQDLLAKREELDKLIENVNKTIASREGRIKMGNKEKFEVFKQKTIKDNEDNYGKEIRGKYGDKAVDESNARFLKSTEAEHAEASKLAEIILQTLHEAMKTGDPASDLAQKAAELHKQWLMFYWKDYKKEAHAGLAQMYVYDERFKAYYDKNHPGTAEFLRDSILIFTKK